MLAVEWAHRMRYAQFSGGAVHGFNPWARAGVDPCTLEDL